MEKTDLGRVVKSASRALFFLSAVLVASAVVSQAEDLTAGATAAAPVPSAATAVGSPVPAAAQTEFIGASACLNCHADKGKFQDSVHAHVFRQVKGIEFEKSCETCHGPGSLHAASGGDKANPGFASLKIFKTMSSREVNQTCLNCHKGGERFHWEGSAHDSRDVSCLSCHSVHSAKSQGEKSLFVKATEMETCFQCHKLQKAQMMKSSHMPVREGKMTCTNCHNPHGGKGPTLLKQATVNENCLTCHAEKRGPFLWEHPPVRENCLNCHLAHGSQHDRLLKARRPRLCQECHDEGRHPSTSSSPTSLRLAGRACTECHSQVHGSNHPSGMRHLR